MDYAQQSFKELEVRLRLFVAARVSNRGDVDDVVQESFLKFHSACRDQMIVNPLGYLCRVALNVIIDQGRRRTPLTNSVDIDGVAESCLAMEASQEQGRRLADLERAYHAALPDLTDDPKAYACACELDVIWRLAGELKPPPSDTTSA